MFVSVMIDPGGEESAAHLSELLTFYGFERVQRACWESSTVSEKQLATLKREIDSPIIMMLSVSTSIPSKGCWQFPHLRKKSGESS